MYQVWSKPKTPNLEPLIIIPYASAYGYTAIMAQSIKEGILEAFHQKAQVELYDLVTADLKTVVDRIEQADALLIGSTTIVGDTVKPVWDVLSSLNPTIHGNKPAAAFGSYGWSGEAVLFITERLNQLKMKTFEGLRIKFNPSIDQLKEIKEYGMRFAHFMQNK